MRNKSNNPKKHKEFRRKRAEAIYALVGSTGYPDVKLLKGWNYAK